MVRVLAHQCHHLEQMDCFFVANNFVGVDRQQLRALRDRISKGPVVAPTDLKRDEAFLERD